MGPLDYLANRQYVQYLLSYKVAFFWGFLLETRITRILPLGQDKNTLTPWQEEQTKGLTVPTGNGLSKGVDNPFILLRALLIDNQRRFLAWVSLINAKTNGIVSVALEVEVSKVSDTVEGVDVSHKVFPFVGDHKTDVAWHLEVYLSFFFVTRTKNKQGPSIPRCLFDVSVVHSRAVRYQLRDLQAPTEIRCRSRDQLCAPLSEEMCTDEELFL